MNLSNSEHVQNMYLFGLISWLAVLWISILLNGPWRWNKIGWGIILSLVISDLYAMLPEALGLAKGEVIHEKLIFIYAASLLSIPVGLIQIALFYLKIRKIK